MSDFNTQTIKARNDALCRSGMFASGGKIDSIAVNKNELRWFRVRGVTSFWTEQTQEEYAKAFESILSGIVNERAPLAFLVNGTQEGIAFYVGCDENLFSAVKGAYCAYLAGADITDVEKYEDIGVCDDYCGILTGHPGEPVNTGTGKYVPSVLQIDDFCRAMLGNTFSLLVVAERCSEFFAQLLLNAIHQEMFRLSDKLEMQRDGVGGVARTVTNYVLQNYFENLTKYTKMIESCIHGGMWNTCVYYSAKDKNGLLRMQGILRGSFASDSTVNYENITCTSLSDQNKHVMHRVGLPQTPNPNWAAHPFKQVYADQTPIEPIKLYQYQFQTVMDSKTLSVFIRLPQKEYAGYYVDEYVEFDSMVRVPEGKEEEKLLLGSITYPGRNVQTSLKNLYSMKLDDLTRHALIIGITGGGKTNTTKSLLRELWIRHGIPFLVIESAKREYWELVNVTEKGMLSETHSPRSFRDLNLFTLGNESPEDSVKYRINPFEAASGVSLQTHIDYLLSTFKAAFELYPPMPYVLESAVFEVYRDRGWDIVNGVNIYGRTDYPTLTDLYYKIDPVTDRLGYHAEVQSNVKAALKARINSLRIGGKGAMLDTPKSLDIGKLLQTPTVFELEDLGDDDTKAFVIGILLVQLYEYRKGDRSPGGKKLRSLLMIEEAHRLLKNVPAGQGDNSRAKSVEFFCNMLAEIRSFGQAIMIADQVPTKLAPDTIKNTNLKIVHRTVMEEDRKIIGQSMNMTEPQIEYLSSMIRGCAAVFSEGDNRPKLVMMPLVEAEENGLNRSQALDLIRRNVYGVYGEGYDRRYALHEGCSFCSCRGENCERILQWAESEAMQACIRVIKQEIGEGKLSLQWIVKMAERFLQNENIEADNDEKICLMGYLLKSFLTDESLKMRCMINYMTSLNTKKI